MPTYTKDKERSFDSFVPFHEIKSRKLYCTAIANVALLAPTSVIVKARQIFNSQMGIKAKSNSEEPDSAIAEDCFDSNQVSSLSNKFDLNKSIRIRQQEFELMNSESFKVAEKLGAQVYRNVDKRSIIKNVLVACSTDGRLKVYYDEQKESKDRKIGTLSY